MSISACALAPRVFAASAHRRYMSDITGSKSFQHEKRRLVLRNLDVLDQRFPGLPAGVSARLGSRIHYDRRARRLDRALTWPSEPSVLILGNQRSFPRHRRGASAPSPPSVASERFSCCEERDIVHLKDADGTSPQAVQLRLRHRSSQRPDAADIIARLHPDRVEIVEPNPLPRLVELMRKTWLAHQSVADDRRPLAKQSPRFPDEAPLLVSQ